MHVNDFVYKMVLRKDNAAPVSVMTQVCAYILSDKWGQGSPVPWAGDIARQVLGEENGRSKDLDKLENPAL